ncbi:hypothetical protein I3843_04G032300 [Carya illinoinensis]|uniref:Prohibitin n=1 Tax=Carya illinoinensis TaxID=32201 RepID=A0A922FA76_CARIL|nr:hypothetical protein I3760_04G032500 [Carya illinoinensis]KAG6716163.1 hypothetical protein I3842_04G033700 [Carya illinoinensis]KAG7982095.1 hypothetical protein I3843_04G032300 [Carya illinoinensis]
MGSQAAVSFLTNIARAALGLGVSATVLNSSLYTVDGGQRAVIFDRLRGILDETVGEGTHFLVPWLQKPFIFDIRTKPHTFSSVSGTKDLQMVNLTLRVLSRPEVSALVRNGLTERARNFNIVLDDVAITHLSYGGEFSRAVEQKQVAQQEAERSKFVVAKAEQERRAAIIRAEGESESAKMISEATAQAGMGLIELRKIEAMRENASTLAKSPNVAYLPGGQQILMALNASR